MALPVAALAAGAKQGGLLAMLKKLLGGTPQQSIAGKAVGMGGSSNLGIPQIAPIISLLGGGEMPVPRMTGMRGNLGGTGLLSQLQRNAFSRR